MILRLIRGLLLVVFVATAVRPSAAQFLDESELGLPMVESIDTKAFGSTPANWSVLQDGSGLMIVGNDLGVWEYDGHRWRYIALDNGSAGRSLALDADGRVLVGGQGTFGYLGSDSLGFTRYISLSADLPDDEQGFGDVWNIAPSPAGTFYRTSGTIFHVLDGRVQPIPLEERLSFMRAVRGRAVVSSIERGLLEVTAEGLRPVPGGDAFVGFPFTCPVVLEHGDEGLLLVTYQRGLFVLDADGTVRPFPTAIDDLLGRVRPYQGVRLPGGRIALATIDSGLIVLESDGRLAFHLHEKNGLPETSIHHVAVDREGGLWALHGSGILRVHAGGAVTHFGDDLSGDDDALAFARFRGELFAASFGGAFRLNTSRHVDERGHTQRPRWERLPGSVSQMWDLLPFDDLLLLASPAGLFTTRGRSLTFLAVGEDDELDYAQVLRRHIADTNVVFIGHRKGVSAIRRTGKESWEVAGWLDSFTGDVTNMQESDGGDLLIGTRADGVFRTRWDGDRFAPAERVPVWPDEGRVAGQHLFKAGGDVFLGFSREEDRPGLQRYDPARRAFFPDSTFGADFATGKRRTYRLVQDHDGDFWMTTLDDDGPAVAVARRAPEGHMDLDLASLRLLPAAAPRAIFPEERGAVWIGSQAGIFRIDPSLLEAPPPIVSPLIRRVGIGADSTVYAGEPRGSGDAAPARARMRPHDNDLRFEYALPAHDSRQDIRYQYRMDGLHSKWSAWTNEAYKDFAGLPAGRYTLRVRARDAYGQISEESSFAFRILPPWYQTWWAYLIYGGLAVGIVASGTRYTAQIRLRRKVRQLEVDRRLHVERERISRDLHDHVGAQLSNIISAVELIHLSARHGEAEQMIQYLDGLDEDARTTMSRLRETIWAIHNERITVEDFGHKVHAFAEDRVRYKPGLSVKFSFEAAPDVVRTTLRPMQALHLFRIAQEAVSNAVKHAEARHLSITLHLNADKHLRLEVRDDGVFKPAVESGPEGGFGMQTMRERAEQIGGDLQLDATDMGTAVRISVPVA